MRRNKNRRGAAVVEFAVVVPVLFILVFGMVEYGRYIQVAQIMTNASREGARIMATQDGTSIEAAAFVRDCITNAGLNAGNVTINIGPVDPKPEVAVTVQLSVPFGDVAWMPPFKITQPVQAQTTMRRESAF